MKNGVQIRHAVIVAAVMFLVSYGLLRVWTTQGNALPDVTWLTVAVELIIAALVFAGGWQIHAFRERRSQRMPSPQWARRVVAAAQASAAVGAALTGWYGGHVAAALHNLNSDRVRDIAIVAFVASLAAVVLVVAGLVVQHWCRIDEDNDDADRPRGGGAVA